MVRHACIVMLAVFCGFENASAIDFTITTVTSNTFLDAGPQVSGPYVVWWDADGAAATREIMRYNHFTQTSAPLTNNAYLDLDPQLSGFYTSWWGEPDGSPAGGAGREIFFHDNVTTSRLTTNSVWDRAPQISGTNVVWGQGPNGTDRQIIKFDGTSTAPLTSGGFNDTPQVSGDNVVFGSGTTPNRVIKMHNGSSTVQLTPAINDTKTKNDPQVSGSQAVWEGFVGNTSNDREIFFHDTSFPSAITNNSFPDFDPQISGDQIVWWGGTFKNFQIYHYDAAALTPTVAALTSSELNQFPQISGNNVVWQGKATLADDFEIFFWDGSTVTQLTDNNFDDTNPQISGFNVVWEAHETTDTEILFAQANLLSGDASLDGRVDIGDFTIWADTFGQFHGNATFTDGDFNGDGKTDIGDFTVWADNFGATAGVGSVPAAAVPEPSTLVLIVIAIFGLIVWHVRRIR